MFACLYLPRPVNTGAGVRESGTLTDLARDFSPRVEVRGAQAVTLDISGLGSLLGDARAIGEELRRAAADRGLLIHIAIASTSTAAMLLAQARAGLTVIPPGEQARALAPLPLSALSCLLNERGGANSRTPAPDISSLTRWGLRTLGDLAALPATGISERLGQEGIRWQQWARGEESRPLVPASIEESFGETLELEWPIEGLEPLSFVLARLFEPLCERLEARDRGAVVLHVTLTLVNKQRHERSLELPAPMRDPRVLRTLALLDLESHPPPAAIDRVAVRVDVSDGRILQFGLFRRALPTERLATLMARLGALMGTTRVGAPALVDTYRPGAFAMAPFAPSTEQASGSRLQTPGKALPGARSPEPEACQALRRFRSPVPARVTIERGRPVHVTTDRRGFAGGKVTRCEGPWRSSGDWWLRTPWNCDEWDVTLADGVVYRLSHSADRTWVVSGMLD